MTIVPFTPRPPAKPRPNPNPFDPTPRPAAIVSLRLYRDAQEVADKLPGDLALSLMRVVGLGVSPAELDQWQMHVEALGNAARPVLMA